jgi:hypothetical protein
MIDFCVYTKKFVHPIGSNIHKSLAGDKVYMKRGVAVYFEIVIGILNALYSTRHILHTEIMNRLTDQRTAAYKTELRDFIE